MSATKNANHDEIEKGLRDPFGSELKNRNYESPNQESGDSDESFSDMIHKLVTPSVPPVSNGDAGTKMYNFNNCNNCEIRIFEEGKAIDVIMEKERAEANRQAKTMELISSFASMVPEMVKSFTTSKQPYPQESTNSDNSMFSNSSTATVNVKHPAANPAKPRVRKPAPKAPVKKAASVKAVPVKKAPVKKVAPVKKADPKKK